MAQASSIGLSIVMCIMIPCLFGVWLDSKAGTAPLFMILLMLFGISAAVFSVLRLSSELEKDLDEKNDF